MPYAKINPTGCGIHKNRAKLRLDFFLNPDEPNYDKYLDTPFHSHFIHPDKDATDTQIKAEIEKCLNYFYALHQHCWTEGKSFIEEWKKVPSKKDEVRCPFVKGDDLPANEAKVQDILSRIQDFGVALTQVKPQDLRIGDKGTIDVGYPVIDRDSSYAVYLASSGNYYTVIAYFNPANASGTIDTVTSWWNAAPEGNSVKIGTFIDNGAGNFTCHDAESIGQVSVGENPPVTGLSVDINTGEYIGCDGRAAVETKIERDTSGYSGFYYKYGAGEAGQYCDPDDTGDFGFATSDDAISLYGTGTEAGAALEKKLTDGVAIADSISKAVGLIEADTITIADTIAKAVSLIKTDTVTIIDAFTKAVSYVLSLVDSVAITDSISKAISIVKTDAVIIADTMTAIVGAIHHAINLFDTVVITDSISKFMSITRSDVVTIIDTISTISITYLKQVIAKMQIKGLDIARMSINKMGIARMPLFRWIIRRWTA